MEQRYIRNLGALSEAECSLLRQKKVFVAGCGGLGGHIIDMLLRVGVGSICAADGDCFEQSNLNRQLLSNADTMGHGKAETARHYAQLVNPEVDFRAYDCFVTAENADELISGCDVVLDGLDSVPARKILKAACDRAGIPYIYGGVTGWAAQAALTMPGDGLLDALYPDAGIAMGQSVLAFTPAVCAALECSLCVRLLTGREVQPGTLYMMALDEPELDQLRMGC